MCIRDSYISEQAKADLREVHKYWKGKTTSELATAYMAPEAIRAIDHNIFTLSLIHIL